jgi:hypothetical protein
MPAGAWRIGEVGSFPIAMMSALMKQIPATSSCRQPSGNLRPLADSGQANAISCEKHP